jgi:hypothetical protein
MTIPLLAPRPVVDEHLFRGLMDELRKLGPTLETRHISARALRAKVIIRLIRKERMLQEEEENKQRKRRSEMN